MPRTARVRPAPAGGQEVYEGLMIQRELWVQDYSEDPVPGAIATWIAVKSEGGCAPNAETIRLWLGGRVPQSPNLELVGWLAKYFGCAIGDLSPSCARRLDLLNRDIACRSLDPGLESLIA